MEPLNFVSETHQIRRMQLFPVLVPEKRGETLGLKIRITTLKMRMKSQIVLGKGLLDTKERFCITYNFQKFPEIAPFFLKMRNKSLELVLLPGLRCFMSPNIGTVRGENLRKRTHVGVSILARQFPLRFVSAKIAKF